MYLPLSPPFCPLPSQTLLNPFQSILPTASPIISLHPLPELANCRNRFNTATISGDTPKIDAGGMLYAWLEITYKCSSIVK